MKFVPDNIYWRLVSPVMVIGLTIIIAVGIAVPIFIKQNVEDTARANAFQVTETFHAIRDFYNRAIVSKALSLENVQVSHLYAQMTNAFPVPATFLLEMTGADKNQNVAIRLSSPYPFAHRKDRVFDDFSKTAWEALSGQSSTYFSRLEKIDGKNVFRVAIADKMTHENCIKCHNNHPDSPKRDWKLGDTRGIIEVRFDVSKQLAHANLLSYAIILGFGAAMVALFWFTHASASKITRPLGIVTSALHNLSQNQGDIAKINLPDIDVGEIQRLSIAFDRFQDREKERKRLVQDIRRLAFSDTLTGLPNKTSLRDLLEHALSPSHGIDDVMPMVILIGINDYHDIIDTIGHQSGDTILQIFANRLRNLNPNRFLITRFTEDSFAVLTFFREGMNRQNLEEAEAAIKPLVEEPFTVSGQSIRITTSSGISYAPDHGTTADQLITAADVALSRAKSEGENAYRIYSDDMSEEIQFRIKILHDLKEALNERTLMAYFQPQFKLATGELIGAEALIRWPKGDGGFIPPDVFIPIAERTQLITDIGHYMIDEVCGHAASWRAAGLDAPKLAINISAVQFMKSNVANILQNVMTRHDLKAHQLEVEITESAMTDNLACLIERLQAIRDIGVEISLDDFGTGYSSLSYLRRLPLDRLKIDRSFVRDMTENRQSRQIVETIINLGRTMNLKVLAEGIETHSEEILLTELGCDEGQGYYRGRPMPPDAFFDFIKTARRQVA